MKRPQLRPFFCRPCRQVVPGDGVADHLVTAAHAVAEMSWRVDIEVARVIPPACRA